MESVFDPILDRPIPAERTLPNVPPNTPQYQPNRRLYPSLQDLGNGGVFPRAGTHFLSFFPPPPYGTLDAVFESPPVSDACHQLTNNVASLRHMIKTRKERVELLRALQELETELAELTLSYHPWLRAAGQNKNQDKRHKVLPFPLYLRSGAKVLRDLNHQGEIQILASATSGLIFIPTQQAIAQLLLLPKMPVKNAHHKDSRAPGEQGCLRCFGPRR